MKPAERARKARRVGLIRILAGVITTLLVLIGASVWFYLRFTPALPVTVTLVDKPAQTRATPQIVYEGDDMKGRQKK